MPSSWVLHCGSQHKVPGQSNTDFDLNLNQTLEFPDETKCTIFNVGIPNCVPNVCDAFENKTWQFTFRMYAMPTQLTAAGADRVGKVGGLFAYHTYTIANSSPSNGLLHSEVTLNVSIPDGNYQFSNTDNNFTENTYINEIADEIVAHPHDGPGTYNVTASNDISNYTANTSWSTWSQLLVPSSKYGITTGDRNRTYIEALQKAIRKAQQQMRYDSLTGNDGLGGVQLLWTDPNTGPSADQLLANENYKKRILRFIVSDMYICVSANANHQPEFIVKTNMSTYSNANASLASNYSDYLANAAFFGPVGTIPFTGGSSGTLTAGWQVNPWMTLFANDGAPTHFVQCKITSPNNIRFQGRHVMNCLDFYVNQFFPILSTTTTSINRILPGDAHSIAIGAKVETTSTAGLFTPYGHTWTSHPITYTRSDPFKAYTVQDGTDGWFNCCFWGVRNAANSAISAVGQYMYMPVYYNNNSWLVYVNDVAFNHRTKTNPVQAGTLALYPAGLGTAANSEMTSNAFTGVSVFISSSALASDSTYYTSAGNLGRSIYNIPTMDYESIPTFIIEIEMFGSGNHMKFTGPGECKRVKITKRMSLLSNTYGGFIKANMDGQTSIDYGTSVGLTKVSSIKCRVLNEKGDVIKLTNLDSFPAWTFSLAFET